MQVFVCSGFINSECGNIYRFIRHRTLRHNCVTIFTGDQRMLQSFKFLVASSPLSGSVALLSTAPCRNAGVSRDKIAKK